MFKTIMKLLYCIATIGIPYFVGRLQAKKKVIKETVCNHESKAAVDADVAASTDDEVTDELKNWVKGTKKKGE